MGELRCAACHDGIGLDGQRPLGPNLEHIGWRVAPDYLKRFIAAPALAQHGTKMPSLLHSLDASERDDIAEAITHFLVARSSRSWSPGERVAPAIDAGEELFHTIGCVACHAPRRPARHSMETPAAGPGAVKLGHVPAKYSLESLTEFLFQPLLVRPSGRMPDMGLDRAEARALASYLIGSNPPEKPALAVQPMLVDLGKQYFADLNCVACHPLETQGATAHARLTKPMDPNAGCLGEPASGAPRFQLGSEQRVAIVQALTDTDSQLSDGDRIGMTLTAFNCVACHVRGDYGGIRPAINAYFETDQHDLGDEARIPPQLTLAGAKLQRDWMRKVLFDRASVRKYMHTRMPRFGEANLAHLPELFEREDAERIEPFEMSAPEGEQARIARDAGRELMGVRGLSCVSCHDFNHKPSLLYGGVDLINSPERLQPSWFARFLIDPQAYRPGIVMPESWSGGVASHTEILGGDTEAQIQALWYFLSQGRTARDPEGIRPIASKLEVTDMPRTYRGRSQVAGFRGIAVGYPGGLNYAFNAQTGTLSAIWQGEFVSVRWDGQGAGGFNPLGRPIKLAQDVSFCKLLDNEAAWPMRPRMDEENPVNPDPLYPRNHGYRFLGYVLDQNATPTFRYASNTVSIEDCSAAIMGGDRPVLRRTLRFSAPRREQLFFRVLTGDLEVLSAREMATPGLRLTLPDVPYVLRTPEGEDLPSELLLELNLPADDSSFTLHYELLD